MTPRVAVVGAGWAGLAAAFTLREAGHAVAVFDAAHEVGGRARRVDVPGFGAPLDNGQHLLLGAYRDTLALMRRLGLDPERQLLRLPFRASSVDGRFDLAVRRLPAPLHLLAGLLSARGLPWSERLAAAGMIRHLQRCDWRPRSGQTVSQLWAATRQPGTLVRRLWLPLCLGALNTPPDEACAALFAAVLRDGLARTRRDSDLLIPRTDLSALWPSVAAHHCDLRLGHPVRSIDPTGDAMRIAIDGETFDAAVLAVPAPATARLLRPLLPTDCAAPAEARQAALHALLTALEAFRHEPIATLNLRFAGPLRLPSPMLMMVDDGNDLGGEWVFDRGQVLGLGSAHGELAIVASSARTLVDQPRTGAIAHLLQRFEKQWSRRPGAAALPPVEATELIIEKRATFLAVPGLVRPGPATPWPRLALAGDWTDTGYPATLEGAVRSGLSAARLVARILDR